MNIDQAIEAALRNIATHGDTDVFPFPFETHVFYDRPDECKTIVRDMHDNFERHLGSDPPGRIITLTQVGYTGFRWATQIEPFWNAYYLALVVSIAEQIEQQRISEAEKTVFSYRFNWDASEAKLFKEITWRHYRDQTLELSSQFKYAVITDVADFYPRIYHHRLQNALERLPSPGDTPWRIIQLLPRLGKDNVSYGLPIGGPASRILAELALNPVDQHLMRRRVRFCRYADDYTIFCGSKSEAYKVLVLLSEKLFNEGLVLQKKKTRILTTDELKETYGLLDPQDTAEATDEQKLLNISIRFDPYSPTAEEDYERLKAAVDEVDIIGILGREVGKTAIDPTVTKQAINAIRALGAYAREGAIKTILDPDNLLVLSPVFVSVMRAIRGVYDDLADPVKDFVDGALVALYDSNSHVLSVELNLSYYVQALSLRRSQRKEEILVELFDKQTSPLIRRQIILIMAQWECHYWLSDIKQHYGELSQWEKRAFILASYFLGDEGDHWRRHTKDGWTLQDLAIRDWFSARFQSQRTVPI